MIGWMVFFAQFVLPVNKLQDRWKVVERLVTYLMGGHGPAIFIENGLKPKFPKNEGQFLRLFDSQAITKSHLVTTPRF